MNDYYEDMISDESDDVIVNSSQILEASLIWAFTNVLLDFNV